jgi:hypothetical protein
VSDPIHLEAQGGGECSPFFDIAADDFPDTFPEGKAPQCVMVPEQTGNVCAYKYPAEGDGGSCRGRDYEMISYESEEAAEADGAHLIHRNGGKSAT